MKILNLGEKNVIRVFITDLLASYYPYLTLSHATKSCNGERQYEDNENGGKYP